MTKALAAVLTPYFQFMRRYQVYPHITHIPGRLNELADELSRFKETLSVQLDPNSQRSIPWIALLQSSGIEITQIGRKWPSTFDIHLREKGLLQSADWVLPSIGFWEVLTPGWSMVDLFLLLVELPTSTGWPQHTPVLGLLTGVSLNGVLYFRSYCTWIGPAGSNVLCTDWTFSAPRLKQYAPAQLPWHSCLECHMYVLILGKLKQRKPWCERSGFMPWLHSFPACGKFYPSACCASILLKGVVRWKSFLLSNFVPGRFLSGTLVDSGCRWYLFSPHPKMGVEKLKTMQFRTISSQRNLKKPKCCKRLCLAFSALFCNYSSSFRCSSSLRSPRFQMSLL